jgi:hypothetical protein
MKTFFARKLVSTLATTGLALGFITGVAVPAQASTACANSAITVGTGVDAGNAYQISTPAQLQWLTLQMNGGSDTSGKFYKVMADLDFAGCTFTSSLGGFPFKGTLDGGNFTISNYSVTGSGYAALIGMSAGAVLKDIVIDGATISGGSYTGALVGLATDAAGVPSVLNNITVRNSSVVGGSIVGGVAGGAFGGSGNNLNLLRVENSNVTAANSAGGIIGRVNDYPSLTKSAFFGGTVSTANTGASNYWIGGLVGLNEDNFAMSEVAFRGNMNLTAGTASDIGFLVGRNLGALSITDSYARGAARVSDSAVVGGLVGTSSGALTFTRGYVRMSVLSGQTQTEVAAHPFSANSATLTTMFYDAERHTSWVSVPAGAGKTATEMETYSTFGPLPGWSFGNPTPPSGTWYWNDNLEAKLFLAWEYTDLTITACPVGRYSFNGILPCIDAPAGSFTAATGRVTAEPCPAGTFQSNAGASGCVPAQAGYFVETIGATAEVQCPPGTFQANAGSASCVPAQAGFFVANAGETAETECEAGTTSNVGATSCFAIATSYGGPLVSGSSAGAAGVSVGERVVLSGSRLGQVSSVSVSGVTAVASCSETSCEFVVPEGVSAGLQDLLLLGSHGVLTIQDGIRINLAGSSLTDGLRVWTRDQGDGTVKVYARDVVGAGKVQFFHNGREVAWVRAIDATDPKLNVASDGMVRTRALVSGRNVFEIFVDGERLVRRIATGS